MGRLPVEIYESSIGSQPELTIDINAASQQEKKKAIYCYRMVLLRETKRSFYLKIAITLAQKRGDTLP